MIPDSGRIRIFGKKAASEWALSIPKRAQVIIVSDSVLRYLPAVPSGWEVRVYPGAVLQDVANLLSTVTPEQCAALSEIVLYVGINNRGDDLETIRSQAREVTGQAIRLNKKAYLSLIPISEKMTHKFKDKIASVNQVLKEEYGGFYVPAIPSFLVKPLTGRLNDVHYDSDTTHWIVRAMAHHVKQSEEITSGGAVAGW